MTTDLLEMTVRLVSAHLSANPVPTENVPNFIQAVHKTLKQLQTEDSTASTEHAVLAAATEAAPVAEIALAPAPAVELPQEEAEQASAEHAPQSEPGPSDPFAGIDPWLAQRISPEVARKLNRNASIHPTVHYDHFICLEDGRAVKLIKPHLERHCKMSLEDYIQKWNLPADYPTVTQAYKEKKGLVPAATAAPKDETAPVIQTDISDPAYEGLDTWLAQRITPAIARKLNPANALHPSVFSDHIICLEDGGKVTLLKSYLRSRFNMSLEDYIKRWNLPADYPSAPPRYSEKRRHLAMKSGLGHTAAPEAEPIATMPAKKVRSPKRVVSTTRASRANKEVIVEKIVRRPPRQRGTLSLFGSKE